MTTPIKYSFELLTNFCTEKDLKLVDDYSNKKLYSSTKINFYCTSCNKENIKCFAYLIKRNTLCKRCVTIQSLPKQKATMLEKYGVEHASQNEEIKNKIKNGFIEKYGVDNPSKLKEIKDKQKKTNLEKYGVEFIVHNKESKEKMEQTNLEKYGSKCCLKNKEIKAKIIKTNLEKFGFENVGQNHIVHQKMKNTMQEKYGVNYPLQNSTIAEKTSKKCYKPKSFIFPSGREITCQGYEPFALKDLIEIYCIDEAYIITGCKNVPTIWYNDNSGKKHRHYVDIYIPSENKCIEVKSSWTINHKKSNIFEKQKTAKEIGYLYEIWVYDYKGNKVETFV
jgi:hypothetical protein